MNKFTLAMKRFGGFLKRNAFYFLIVLCLASVATVIALAVTRNNNNNQTPQELNVNSDDKHNQSIPDDTETNGQEQQPEDQQPEPVANKLTFIVPCNGAISQEYSDTVLVWSSTLKQYSTHTGTDFTSDDGNVFASANGAVKEVGYNALDGNYIVLTHGDGYITKYMSLESLPTLKVGDQVEQGQLLGKMSTTQGTESLDGNHLHFEMTKNGEDINPLEVFVLDEK